MARRFTEQLGHIMWDKLDEQTDARLLEIIAECQSLTTTNCGWVAYRSREVVAAVAENILQLRRDAEARESQPRNQ